MTLGEGGPPSRRLPSRRPLFDPIRLRPRNLTLLTSPTPLPHLHHMGKLLLVLTTDQRELTSHDQDTGPEVVLIQAGSAVRTLFRFADNNCRRSRSLDHDPALDP